MHFFDTTPFRKFLIISIYLIAAGACQDRKTENLRKESTGGPIIIGTVVDKPSETALKGTPSLAPLPKTKSLPSSKSTPKWNQTTHSFLEKNKVNIANKLKILKENTKTKKFNIDSLLQSAARENLDKIQAAKPAPHTITLTPPASIANQVPVGILLPLTGKHSLLGKVLLDAAILALFDMADANFMLLPFDTKGTAEGGALAAEKAVASGIQLGLGPVFSEAVAAASPILLNSGVNAIAFSNDQSVARPGIYIAGLPPEIQITQIIKYAAAKGITRIAALAPSTPFGTRALDTAQKATSKNGIELVATRKFGKTPTSIADAIQQISDYKSRRGALLEQRQMLSAKEDEVSKRALIRLNLMETIGALPFDGLFIATSGLNLVQVAALLSNFDIDTKYAKLLGLSSWGAHDTGKEPALVNAWFAAPPIDADDEFIRKFQRFYGEKPHPLGSLVYDLVALAAIIGSNKKKPRFDRKTLTSETGFLGAGGLFRLLPNGTSERSLEIREVKLSGNRLLMPARTSFAARQN